MGNTSKASSIVATLCIVIYIAAVAFGAVRIIVNIGERKNLAEKEFYDLSDRASSSAVFLGFMSEPYRESLRDFIGASSTLLGVIITGSTGEYAFEREAGNGITWAGSSPRFKIGPGVSSEPFFMPLRVEGQRNVTIQAIYNYLDYGFFQKVLRSTLFTVLAALLIAFGTLIAETIYRNKHKSIEAFNTDEPEKAESQALRQDSDVSSSIGASAYESSSFEPTPIGSLKTASETMPETPLSSKNPQGLFTPRGNIGWEPYTQDRLASELHRCSAFEQDLTFMAMGFPGPVPVYREFADEAVNFFSMRDLIFEKGESCITVIIPNVNLEKCIVKSEEFRARLSEKLPEFFEDRTMLCVGLSSRSGRLIEADRLMMEAHTALQKAFEGTGPGVVAFKSDPERYREFIAKQP